MSHHLPLSRVARLVGLSRSVMQAKIRNGELTAFDGEIELDELLRVFPDVQWRDEGDYKRVTEIKEKAFGKRIMEHALPDKEVLAERLYELAKEHAGTQTRLDHYERIFEWLDGKLQDLAEHGKGLPTAVDELRAWVRRQMAEVPAEAGRGNAVMAQENLLRIMSPHVTVRPSGYEFFVEGNDTLLEAALRAGISLNYGCSNGNCGECRGRLLSGQLQKVHPHDYCFREAEKAEGTFLMCSYTAVGDVVVEAGISGAEDIPHQVIDTRVRALEEIGNHLIALHLTTPRSRRLHFLAGQRVNLSADGVSGEYYVASCPCEDRHVELHVRRDNRPFARKVFDELRKEDTVTLEGPLGNFVIKMDSRRPLVFVAWGDGFAPIKSLVQHAISLETAESMHLYRVADALGHYQENLCRSWADALDNFSYVPLEAGAGNQLVAEAILSHHPDLNHADLYAAGPAGFLHHLRDGAIARGLSPLGWHGEAVL